MYVYVYRLYVYLHKRIRAMFKKESWCNGQIDIIPGRDDIIIISACICICIYPKENLISTVYS